MQKDAVLNERIVRSVRAKFVMGFNLRQIPAQTTNCSKGDGSRTEGLCLQHRRCLNHVLSMRSTATANGSTKNQPLETGSLNQSQVPRTADYKASWPAEATSSASLAIRCFCRNNSRKFGKVWRQGTRHPYRGKLEPQTTAAAETNRLDTLQAGKARPAQGYSMLSNFDSAGSLHPDLASQTNIILPRDKRLS